MNTVPPRMQRRSPPRFGGNLTAFNIGNDPFSYFAAVYIEQQIGMPFIIMQQEQPALIMFIMQSQQA
jgi:hypothetical protein